LGILSNFFSKVLSYHFLPDKSKYSVAAALNIKTFFLSEYEMAAKKYSVVKIIAIISYLREYDLKSKGIGSNNVPDGELLKELIFKILH
jgi:DNA polymerase-3 subunit delta